MIESAKMCRKYPYHKQKIRFILSSMREFAQKLEQEGRKVHYIKLEDGFDGFYDSLEYLSHKHSIDKIVAMESSDRKPSAKLREWCEAMGLEVEITANSLFLTSKDEFANWADVQKSLKMENFYRWQRQRLNILMDGDEPLGGRWNYDQDNRKPLPSGYELPVMDFPAPTDISQEVTKLVEDTFANHPGSLDTYWLPVNHEQANTWLDSFIDSRLEHFGAYEDAMAKGQPFLNHSVLSAMLNAGLLHPEDVVDAIGRSSCSLNSKEGFIRQVIGWREFMYQLYHYKDEAWMQSNYFGFTRDLEEKWWRLQAITDEPPIEEVLKRLHQYGYSHHIERLMVLGNFMLLSHYRPQSVYDWFMSMYVDAYEWVMVPNVIGMSQYADGGIDNDGFATKPYISGANYLQKMGRWWPSQSEAKDSEWTAMYWHFLKNNKAKLANNYRLKPLYSRLKD